MTTPFSFELLATDGAARRGVIHTARGDIRTPAFIKPSLLDRSLYPNVYL